MSNKLTKKDGLKIYYKRWGVVGYLPYANHLLIIQEYYFEKIQIAAEKDKL